MLQPYTGPCAIRATRTRPQAMHLSNRSPQGLRIEPRPGAKLVPRREGPVPQRARVTARDDAGAENPDALKPRVRVRVRSCDIDERLQPTSNASGTRTECWYRARCDSLYGAAAN